MYELPFSYDTMDAHMLSCAGAQQGDVCRTSHASNGLMAVSSHLSGPGMQSSSSSLDFFDVFDDRDFEGCTSFSYTGDTTGLSSVPGAFSTASTSASLDYSQQPQQPLPTSSSHQHPDAERRARHKCSPAQLAQLSSFFHFTRNPTGKMRAELAQRLGMPERSVQIWFQNRRAKIRAREGVDGGRMGSDRMTTATDAAASSPMSGTGMSTPCMPPVEFAIGKSSSLTSPVRKGRRRKTDASESGLESITFLPSYSISIGTWRRVQPLVCFFSRNARTLTWALKSDSVGFKLELPWSSIEEMSFRGPLAPAEAERAEGVCEREPLGVLCVRLTRPPIFSMEVFRSAASKPAEGGVQGGARWRQCEDFTEGRQGTATLMHVLSGPFAQLREAVLALKQCHPDLDAKTHLLDEVSMSNAQAQQYRSVDPAPLQTSFSDMRCPQQPYALQQRPADLPTDSNDLDFYSFSGLAGFAPSHDFFSHSGSIQTSPTQLLFLPEASTSATYGLRMSTMDGSASLSEGRHIASSYTVEPAHPPPTATSSPPQPHWLSLAQKEHHQQQQQQQRQSSSAPLRSTHAETYAQLFESLPTQAQAGQQRASLCRVQGFPWMNS